MMLFRKRKARGTASDFSLRIGGYVERQQRKAADYLARKTAYWNRASKLIALVLFSLLFGGCALFLLLKAIIHL